MTAPTDTPSPATCPGCGGPTTYAANIGTFCPSKDCDRVDDMRPAKPTCTRCNDTGETRSVSVDMSGEPGPPSRCPCTVASLTTEQARVLATHWAEAKAGKRVPMYPAVRDHLFAWVRARASAIRGIPSYVADTIAEALGLTQQTAVALLLAAGWPS